MPNCTYVAGGEITHKLFLTTDYPMSQKETTQIYQNLYPLAATGENAKVKISVSAFAYIHPV